MKTNTIAVILMLASIVSCREESTDPIGPGASPAEPKRLAFFVQSRQESVNGMVVMVPDSKAIYRYDASARINSISYYSFSDSLDLFVPTRQSTFSYTAAGVSQIITDDPSTGQRLSVDSYTYEISGRLTHIQHNGVASGIITEVGIAYDENDRLIKADYQNSNGRGFDYEFSKENGNMVSDRTTMGSQLCSAGTYSYDNHINPFKHLGYVDFLFQNYSINNRIAESVLYNGCGTPTFKPESYSYTYDTDGYPLVVTTHYQGTAHTTQVEYTYQ